MTSPAVLDSSVLDQLRAIQRPGRPSLLERVVAIFATESAELLEELARSIDDADADAAGQAAHRLKSVCGNVGALTMSAQCAAIERLARAGEMARIPEHVEELAQEQRRVDEALQVEIGVAE